MTRVAWLTDVHLNFLEAPGRRRFADEIAATGADAVLITGDIGEAPDVIELLEELAGALARPIWFVLGNHDFYRGSIAEVRARAADLTARHRWLAWLPARGSVRLSDDTILVGHDGWGDARLGDFERTPVMLNDFLLIEELLLSRPELRTYLHHLGDDAAAYLSRVVDEALTAARHVLVATHVPPFRETCWHEGRVSDDNWLPFFTCAAVGETLRAAMTARPDARMTVVCGHTHGSGVAELLPNLTVLTGGAEYGAPVVQRVFEL